MIPQIIILVAALAITWLVFTGLLKIIKTSVGTAFKIAVIVLALQVAFGISPYELWQEIITLPQRIQNFLN
ncbi:MAG: hypothetical protein AB4058_17920 [Microcystaceae cyanobacterium]